MEYQILEPKKSLSVTLFKYLSASHKLFKVKMLMLRLRILIALMLHDKT